MGAQYFCTSVRRRQGVQDSALNGVDYLEVLDLDAPAGSPRQQTLLVRFLKDLPVGLDAGNVRLEGGVRVTPVKAEWAARASDAAALFADGTVAEAERDFLLALPDPDRVLAVRTDSRGDYSTYRFLLVASPTNPAPPPGFDPVLREVAFSFKVECPSDFDCKTELVCPPEVAAADRDGEPVPADVASAELVRVAGDLEDPEPLARERGRLGRLRR